MPTPDAYADHTFLGWSDGTTTYQAGTEVAITKDTEFNALWGSNNNTVTWKNADGTVLETDINVPYGSTPTYDGATPTKAGNSEYTYSFNGWTPNVSAVTGNAEYTATFTSTPKSYTVTYKVDGETYGNVDTVAYGSTLTARTAPTKTGYTFSGWSEIPATMPDENVVITGTFTANQHTVTYKVDGETYGDVDTVAYGTALTAREAPTKTGYTFSGWSEIPATMPDNDVVITGTFTANTYTVHFDPVIPVNGEMADQSFTYDDEAKALTKHNFSTTTGEWLGWNTKPDGTGTSYTDEQEVRNLTAENGGTVTLYAQWHLPKGIFFDQSIFDCVVNGESGRHYYAYPGESVQVFVNDNSSEHTVHVYTITDVNNGNYIYGNEIKFDTDTNTFTMPNLPVHVTSTSKKRMDYTNIYLDDFESYDDVVYLYDADHPTVTPTVVVKDGDTVLTEGTDYTLSITNNTGSPDETVTATVTITGIGDHYTGTTTKTFRIANQNIENCEIKGKLEAYNDGYGLDNSLSNNVEVWFGETQLEFGNDYYIELDPNIDVDSYKVGNTYTATIVGRGDWGGSQEFTFTVVELYHTVVFNANGGEGTIANDTVQRGQHYILPDCPFTPPYGYEFDRWDVSCGEDNYTVEYYEGNYLFTAPYIFNESDVQTITVTAHWKEKAKYSVVLPECVELVSGIVDNEGKAYTGEVLTFGVKDSYYVRSVSLGGTPLNPDANGIYTVTVSDADINVTADFSAITDLSALTNNYTAQDGDILSGSTSQTINIADGASIILKDADIYGGIVCNGSATITLAGTNNVSISDLANSLIFKTPGIQIGGSGTTLTIRGNGSLTATGGSQAAGIGIGRTWDASVTAGSIVIEGGTITANGDIGIGIGTVGNSRTAAIDGISIKGGTMNASLGKGNIYNGSTATIGYIKIYDTIDMVDASKITDTVTYMHGDTNVTANKTDYFTIGENGDRRVIAQKDNTDYAVTIDDSITHGTVTGVSTAKYCESVTLTITPDDGYRLKALSVTDDDNNSVTVSGTSFIMPKGNVTVTASFVKSTAVLNTSTGVLTLSGNVDADEVKAYKSNGFGIASPVTSVVCESGTVLPEDCSQLFRFFNNTTTIDLSNADISGVLDMSRMFESCPKLTTIYVSSSWNMENVKYSETMFESCYFLTGGNGTKWSEQDHSTDEAHKKAISGTYAVIDGKDGQPGYLTAPYSVALNTAEHGTITANKTKNLLDGDTVTLTVTPNEHYQVKSVTVNGTAATKIDDTHYSFTMPAGDVTVSAEFEMIKTEVIIDSVDINGISTPTTVYAETYTSTAYTVPASPYLDGYTFTGWTVNDTLYTTADTVQTAVYNLVKAETPVTVSVVYTKKEDTHTVNVDVGGAFSDGSKEKTFHVSDIVTVIADQQSAEQQFAYWKRGDQIVSYDRTYSFFMPNKDIQLTAI